MQRSEFEQLYQDNIDRVYKFIYYRVGANQEIAEDLTSEVFMKALEHRTKIDTSKAPTAYLMTIARNRLKNYYRDRKHDVDVDDLAHVLSGEDGRAVLAAISDGEVVRQALGKISKPARRIVELKYLQGFSFKEIAEMVGKSAGAVRVTAHRAMKELQQHYES